MTSQFRFTAPTLFDENKSNPQNESHKCLSTTAAAKELEPEVATHDLLFLAVVTLALGSLILFAVVGNILVIAAVVLDTNLRKTNNYFIVSLACADTMVASVVMTFALLNDLLGRWIFGDVVCRLWMSADVMCSTASILSLCAVSLDRWIHIRRPLHYERWITSRRALTAVLFVWLLSALISFVPIQLDWHRQYEAASVTRGGVDPEIAATASIANHSSPEMTSPGDDDQVASCTMSLSAVYAIVSSLVSFYVPCVVIIIIYVKMYHYAQVHINNIRRITAIAGMCAATTGRVASANGAVLTAAPPPRNRIYTSEHKAAVTLGVIVGVFLVCWTPFFTVNVVGAAWPASIPPTAFTVCTWLGYLNSSMNPVIYCIFNQDFRIAFKRILLSVPPPRTFSFRAAKRTTTDTSGESWNDGSARNVARWGGGGGGGERTAVVSQIATPSYSFPVCVVDNVTHRDELTDGLTSATTSCTQLDDDVASTTPV